jgi:BirA family biotin operon repressor/biotin-[acetyl-CoA-carboxylase] ligase
MIDAAGMRILELLRGREGGFAAWDELCRATTQDRRITEESLDRLRASGYVIEERAGHGMRLTGEPESFSTESVSDLVPGGFLSGVHVYGVVGSTNEVAGRLAAGRLAAGRPGENAIVVAEAQRSGRGRHRRPWISPPGVGLWFSLILWPRVKVTEMAALGLVASISVASAIRRHPAVHASVKWPNDVLIGRRKVCGILSELGGSERTPCAIVGIGINVNQQEEDFPASIRESACSLRMHTGTVVERGKLLAAVLEEMAGRYERVEKEGFAPFRAEWEGLSTMPGRKVRLAEGRLTLTGTVLGVSDSGALRICDGQGEEHRILAGDLEFLD